MGVLMRDGWGVVVFFGIVAALILIVWIGNLRAKGRKFDELEPKLRLLESRERELQSRIAHHESAKTLDAERRKREDTEWARKVAADRDAIENLATEKSIGFPWLASAIADYFQFQDNKVAYEMERKGRPALRAAQKIRKISALRREAEQERRAWKYKAIYYEGLVPWLVDAFDKDFGNLLDASRKSGYQALSEDEKDDPILAWLAPEEYAQLSETERNQKALDRYVRRKKSKWEIGRDYERFVGYKYEQAGCSVIYHGIIEGWEDLGRDIIATKGAKTHIVQCKYWSQSKTIYEKHICQLIGTTIEFALAQKQSAHRQLELFIELLRERQIAPVFCTSTELSDKARLFAKVLGVEVHEKLELGKYPLIKCNVARRTGEKIYHLPFDQQYDKTVVEPERGELYTWSVKEAEDRGFRRAWRWRPERDD